jgi:hypothetical protein
MTSIEESKQNQYFNEEQKEDNLSSMHPQGITDEIPEDETEY